MAFEANGATSHRSAQVAAAHVAARVVSRVVARVIGPGLIAVAVLVVAALVHGQGAVGFQAIDDLAQTGRGRFGRAAAAASTAAGSTGRLRWSWIATQRRLPGLGVRRGDLVLLRADRRARHALPVVCRHRLPALPDRRGHRALALPDPFERPGSAGPRLDHHGSRAVDGLVGDDLARRRALGRRRPAAGLRGLARLPARRHRRDRHGRSSRWSSTRRTRGRCCCSGSAWSRWPWPTAGSPI